MAFSLNHSLEFLRFFFLFLFCSSAHSHVPAIYVLGSSQVDAGNNNYLSTVIKINFYPYGIDLAGGKSTGRFSNGKNAADFVAEKLGLPSPKPYLSLTSKNNKTSEFLKGVNFASGGAGVLDNINQGLCIPFSKQVVYFAKTAKAIAKQIGIEQAYRHLSKSIIVISIGNNDILAYTGVGSSTIQHGITLKPYVHQIISSTRSKLKRMYKHGARKFLIIGAGAQGCLPVERVKQKGGVCNEEANQLSKMFNQKLVSLLKETQSKFSDFRYAFFNMYNGYVELYRNRRTYGFDEVNVACCGGGFLNSTVFCSPKTIPPCSNRRSHLFWDGIHNTEATAGVYMSIAYHGSSPFVYPMNLKQLNDV
ncbi:putative triacylglycerol lipase [Dioscorea sansibarensis]